MRSSVDIGYLGGTTNGGRKNVSIRLHRTHVPKALCSSDNRIVMRSLYHGRHPRRPSRVVSNRSL